MRTRVTELATPEFHDVGSRLAAEHALPFAATKHWLSLSGEDAATCARDARGVPLDPILAQALPSSAEFESRPEESPDPLGEADHSPTPRLVHQYPSRVLLRASGECGMFCRYCFRRSLLPAERGFMTAAELDAAEAYLAAHAGVREVLVSGGDPLTASDERLEDLFTRLRRARPGVSIRLCTRMPVVLPSRVTPELGSLLRRFRPLRLVVQVNHPRELAPDFAAAAGLVLDAGVPVRSQTVLLAGVNDDADTLESLFLGLHRIGIDPYYLFQGDLARGTAHFRVPLSRGLAIYGELCRRLSGLELPRYAVDAPSGGGKILLPEGVAGREGDWWLLRTRSGAIARYPEEAPTGSARG